MAISGSVEIKVTPDVLNTKANEVTGYITAIQQAFDEIKELVAKSSSYWIGEAGDHHRKQFQKQEGNIDQILKRLREHPEDLQKIAGTYREAESKQQDSNEALPTNLIG